jgi:hypothetical protein
MVRLLLKRLLRYFVDMDMDMAGWHRVMLKAQYNLKTSINCLATSAPDHGSGSSSARSPTTEPVLSTLLRYFVDMDMDMAGWHRVMLKAQYHQNYRERERFQYRFPVVYTH